MLCAGSSPVLNPISSQSPGLPSLHWRRLPCAWCCQCRLHRGLMPLTAPGGTRVTLQLQASVCPWDFGNLKQPEGHLSSFSQQKGSSRPGWMPAAVTPAAFCREHSKPSTNLPCSAAACSKAAWEQRLLCSLLGSANQQGMGHRFSVAKIYLRD